MASKLDKRQEKSKSYKLDSKFLILGNNINLGRDEIRKRTNVGINGIIGIINLN